MRASAPQRYRRQDAERAKWIRQDRRRYRKIIRRARWEDRLEVPADEREAFENVSFGNQYPTLSQLKIPAARRRAIMATQGTRKKEKEMSQSDIASCRGSSDPDLNWSARGSPTTFSPSKPYLTLLPLEIQLPILKYCLTTETPFIDFCFGYRFAASEVSTDEPRGQDCVSLALLATNRHFRAVGSKIFWEQNNFLYTRSDEFTVLNTDTLMSLPQITLLRHMTIHRDSIWPGQMFYDRVMLDSVLFAVSVTELFPVLQSLHIDLKIGEIYPYPYERGKWLRATLLEAHYFIRDIRKGRPLRELRRLSITGVSDDDLGCLAIKLASYLVTARGRLGVTLADVEQRKPWSHEPTKIVPGDHDIIWVKTQDVDMWVSQRLELQRDQRRVFEWADFFPNETHRLDNH